MGGAEGALPGRPEKKAPRFFYGWVIVWLSFTTLAFHMGARFSFGIFQVPLIAEFGWSRGIMGGAFSLSLAVYALCSPYAGSLLEKRGPRAVMPWGSVLIGAGMAGGFFIASLGHVFLFLGLVSGLGLALSGYPMHSAVIPRWFVKKRGLATGIALAGTGVGTLFLSPVIERIIALWGWRAAYLALGMVILLIIAPANFLLLRNRPEDVGEAPDGMRVPPAPPAPPAPPGPKARGGQVRAVFRRVRVEPRFWVLVSLAFIMGMNNNTVRSQILLHLTDVGFSMAAGAVLFGAMGLMWMAGSVGGGWLGDLIGRGAAAAISAFSSAAGIFILLLVPALGGGILPVYLFVLLFALGGGGLSSCYSALAGDCFEGPSYGVIIGFVQLPYGLGGVIGPPFAGLMFDYTRSYQVPFSVLILALLCAVFLSLWLHRADAPARAGR